MTSSVPELPPEDFDLRPEDFVPSLREALEAKPLDMGKVWRAAVPVRALESGHRIPSAMPDRRLIVLSDGTASCCWRVDSLRALFRGNALPPHLGDYPEAYSRSFATFDLHAVEISTFAGDRRDEELLEIYSMLRRRPDGRSLGYVHDYFWQAAALILGTRPLSQAEFEAILARLERSCRTFRIGPTSRNYVGAMRHTYLRDKNAPKP